jgi:hypothetical protein
MENLGAESIYVVSFERRRDRLSRIWVIWSNGRQSDEKWKGRVEDQEFILSAERRHVINRISLTLDSTRKDRAHLRNFLGVYGGHVPIEQTADADCSVRTAELSKDAA